MPAALLQFCPATDDTLSTSPTSLPSRTSSTALSSAVQKLSLATVCQWLMNHDQVGLAIVEDMARSLLLTKVSVPARPPPGGRGKRAMPEREPPSLLADPQR